MGKLTDFFNNLLSKGAEPTEPAKSEFGPGVGRAKEQLAKEHEFEQAVERERSRKSGM